METAAKNKGKLQVVVDSHMSDSDYIPKQLQVLGADMTLKQSNWLSSKGWDHELTPGVYMIRLNLSSGKQLEQIAHIISGEVTNLKFDIGQFSPRETQEWMYLTKSNSGENPSGPSFRNISKQRLTKSLENVSARRWNLESYNWVAIDDVPIKNVFIDDVGETFQFHVPQAMQLLEVEVPGKPSCFVCLPPGQHIKCMIKIAEGPENVVPELDVLIGTSKGKAQALLSLITSGDMARARTLSTVRDAESLLQSKMIDAASAAIGGYFLLKTGDLERMHDWANNLANWFPWMPDGSIIHAWQMIQQGVSTPDIIPVIRNRFLEALNRGIPVYTEGMRLLYEGLNMLSYELKKEDKAVEQALSRVKQYMCFIDLSQETTTYTGAYPDKPGSFKKDGDDRTRPTDKIQP